MNIWVSFVGGWGWGCGVGMGGEVGGGDILNISLTFCVRPLGPLDPWSKAPWAPRAHM